jgi:hydrogenase nickel incorporation protein HypA/HybF
MHEMSITQGIVEICENSADGRQVLSVTIEIGELSSVIPEAVEFCFEASVRDSALEGTRLIIERVPALGRCLTCFAEFHVRAYYDACPSCGNYGVDILTGDELRVKELEVE